MNNPIKLAGAVALATILASAGTAFAANAPTFTVDNGQTASDFGTALGYFKPSDISALDHAKSVKVVTYNSWSLDAQDGESGDQKTAVVDKMGDIGSQIAATQKALSADPAAVNVLKSGGISVGSVAGVEAGRNGDVTLYVE